MSRTAWLKPSAARTAAYSPGTDYSGECKRNVAINAGAFNETHLIRYPGGLTAKITIDDGIIAGDLRVYDLISGLVAGDQGQGGTLHPRTTA